MVNKAETLYMEQKDLGWIEETQKRRKQQKQKKPANPHRLY